MGDAAGCLQHEASLGQPHRLGQRRNVHVVEQHDIGHAGVEHLAQLGQRIDLDLDLDQMPDLRARPRASTGRMPPATAMWLSLIRIASSSPKRWLKPPPQRTAYFSSARSPGVVFRVQQIRALVPASGGRKPRSAVATPQRRPTKVQRDALGGE